MEKLAISWAISCSRETVETVNRYCPACAKVVAFRDSLIRRHNANGKNIHQYAIYKCEREHTWNRKLAAYKSSLHENSYLAPAQPVSESTADSLRAGDSKLSIAEETRVVEIRITQTDGRVRLDKLLAERLSGLSRSQIIRWIAAGRITLNNAPAKPGEAVTEGSLITIHPR